MKKIYVYLHVCCINNWKSVVKNIYDQIKESGLYEKTQKIKCSVIGCKDEFLDFVGRDGKTEVIFSSIEEKYFSSNYRLISTKFSDDTSRPIHNEEIILNKMFDDAQQEDFYVLYLHSKGVKRIKELPRQNSNIEDWVDLMLWFNVYNFEYVIEKLHDFDGVGVNIEIKPEKGKEKEKTRFTGNFWWSKSEYIKKLGKELSVFYGGPEDWLCCKGNFKFLSVWNSYIDHHNFPYSRAIYENKPIKNIVVEFKDRKLIRNDLKSHYVK